MSKMIIYFCLFIPLLFLSTDSSSIRGRNHKNDLVPFLSSRLDTMKKDPNSMKVVSKEPFIIQLQMPNSKETEARRAKEKDKKRKPVKKRVSKIKPLRKKHRKRRDLIISKTKPRGEKPIRFEISRAGNETGIQLKNTTRNSLNRVEILKALSSYPKNTETKRSEVEGTRDVRHEEKISSGKTKKNNTSNRSLPKHHLSLVDRTKMSYPNTPKPDRQHQKYTYRDLMADRERIEQKIKYIKNMLNVNDSTSDDIIRVRRRSDSDRTANKIAKMFLTLSAVNGLHDRRKSKCKDEDDGEDRVEDVWEKERRNNPFRKSTSSNEERYKVKKWIEFMKNKRSSGKTCPCAGSAYGEESEAFPLEQRLPKGYLLLERGRSSEESSELYGDSYYYSRDKINKNDNGKKRLSKSQDQDAKNKALSNNGKKKLELPFEDLELYRSRARQILQNAEEILDKIKEEEEKRLAAPNILMSQLKELTSRIHGDPRNNENDLIRKIQKNLGWGPLAKPQDNTDGIFLDNVKSFILDPYEKAKALTDESTKKLSTYLLRNLGRFQESFEEQETKNADDKTDDETLKIYFGEVPHKEENLSSANLVKEEPRSGEISKDKEDLKNWEDTLSAILGGDDDAVNKENNWDSSRELSQQETEDLIKESPKKLNDYKGQSSKEIETVDNKESTETLHPEKEIVAESKPESVLEEEIAAMKSNETETDENNQEVKTFQSTNEKDEKGIKSAQDPGAALKKTAEDSDIVKNKKFRGMERKFREKKNENNDTASRDMQEEEEFEKETEEVIESITDKENDKESSKTHEGMVENLKVEEKKAASEDFVAEVLEKQQENEKGNEKGENEATASPEIEEIISREEKSGDSTSDERVGKKDVLSPSTILITEASPNDYTLTETEQNSKEIEKANLEDEFESNEKPVLEKQRKLDGEQSKEEMKVEENKSTLENFREDVDLEREKESPLVSGEILRENKKEDPSTDEITRKESASKTIPEYADLVQKIKESSKEFSEENSTESKLESSEIQEDQNQNEMGKEETLKPDGEEKQGGQFIRKEYADGETLKAILDNEDMKEGKIENGPREELTEDQNPPLRATLENQENSNDPNLNLKISSAESDVLLKETNSEDEKNETPEDINDETMKEIVENKSWNILDEEKRDKTSFSAEKLTEDRDNYSKSKSLESENVETFLKETNSDEGFGNVQEGGEILLRTVMSNQEDQDDEEADETQEYNSSEVNEKDRNLDKEGGNEGNLEAKSNKDENVETNDEITLEAKNLKPDEKYDEIQSLNENQEIIFESENPAKDTARKTYKQENDDGGRNDTLGVLNIQENLDERGEEMTISKEHQKAENITGKDDVETVMREENSDEVLNIEEKETSQELLKSLNNWEMENPTKWESEENLKEANPKGNIQNEKSGNSKEKNNSETLKANQGYLKEESMEMDEYELDQGDVHSSKPSEDENLEAVLKNETQESLKKRFDKETLKIVKVDDGLEQSQESNLETTSENQDVDEELKDVILKEANMDESEEKQDNLKDNNDVGAVFDIQGQTGESRQNLDEDKSKKNEDIDDEKILLKEENFDEDLDYQNNQNSNDETQKVVSNEQNQEKLKENYENLQAKNYEDQEKEEDYETPLRSDSLEDEFDNKIQYETPLKSARSEDEIDDLESIKSVNEVGSEETLRTENVPYDLNYQVDEERKDEATLKLVHFDGDSPDGLNEGSYETLRNENLEAESPSKATNPDDAYWQENLQETFRNLQKPGSASKSLKASKLKVPESIGKIMKDLDGKEKSDITSIQNLHPEKIDHMLDKIGEAEQQNLLESEEVDCRKECACAEEMNTKFRNIGRYEIVKDFLQWVKDLQLNRVLSDD